MHRTRIKGTEPLIASQSMHRSLPPPVLPKRFQPGEKFASSTLEERGRLEFKGTVVKATPTGR
jgi:hypothetical protein